MQGGGGGGAGRGKNAGSQTGGSVYDTSANAMNDAYQGLYNAAGLIGKGTLQQGGATTYDPTMQKATFGQASTAADPSAIYKGVNNYMNPYTDQVINRAQTDVNNQLQQQLGQVGSNASQVGAFGGSRHGLVEATAMSEAQKNIGDMSANLRNQGFNTALQYSGQDVANRMQNNQFNAGQKQNMGLANLGYQNQAAANNANAWNTAGQYNAGANNQWNMNAANQNLNSASALNNLVNSGLNLSGQAFGYGQSIDQAQAQQGQQQQDLLQNILNMSSGQYQGYTGQPTNVLNMMLQSLGMNPLNNTGTTTQTSTPGWLETLGLGVQSYGAAKGGR